jgi:DNA-binding GntR family transcriptional regulator
MQPELLTLDRPNISEALASALREMIVDGRLPAGERVNEVHLAARLGVSRTPLREALGRLAAEGALESVPRIGYFIRPLTLEEFEQIYPIRAMLDPEGLRLAGVPSRETLERLRKINEKIARTRGVNKVIALDDAWHMVLLKACPNRVLLQLIEQFMQRTRRYEVALMREQRNVRVSIADHREIMAALTAGNLDKACAALRRNMESGFRPIVSWLKSREGDAKHPGASSP